MPNTLNLTGIALTVEQGKWKRLAHRIAQEQLAPNAATVDLEGKYPRENLKVIGKAGLMALPVSRDIGGQGQDILTTALVTEELAQGCASTAMCYHMHMCTVPLLAALARDEQIESLLRPAITGQWQGAFAMSEPGSGNRMWHMDSYAVDAGDHYVVDSFKSFATSAGQCDYYLVPVRASADVGPSEMSLFVIDGHDANVVPIGTWDSMGMRGTSSTPVHFKAVQVPRCRRLGAPTCGFSMMFSYSLPIYQVGLAAVYLGIGQAAYDYAVAHVKKRIHSDTRESLSRVETIQRYIAEMRLRVDQVRCMLYRVAQMSDNATVLFDELASADLLDEIIRENPDDPFFIEVAQLKVAACEMAIDVTNKALQVCGGTAYKRGHPVERLYRDARAGSVMAPADDSLKVIVGKQILGIPQPWE